MSVIWMITYGVIYSFSEMISQSFGEPHILTVFAVMLYLVALYLFLKRRNRLSVYGLCLPEYWRKKDIGWLIPLLTFSAVNMYLRGNQTILQNSRTMFILTLFTAFLEELLFRGYLPVYLFENIKIKNKTLGMVIPSVLFGVFHGVNLFQGADILYTMIQMLCAFGIGLCLSVVASHYKSILPGAIIHYLINITSFDAGKTDYNVLLLFFILSALYVFYACLLDRKWRTVS